MLAELSEKNRIALQPANTLFMFSPKGGLCIVHCSEEDFSFI